MAARGGEGAACGVRGGGGAGGRPGGAPPLSRGSDSSPHGHGRASGGKAGEKRGSGSQDTPAVRLDSRPAGAETRGGGLSMVAWPPYPFSAVVETEDLGLALLLNAVSPAIGGVLVPGEKGTAKSTMVPALAALLPQVDLVVGCPVGCDPAPP